MMTVLSNAAETVEENWTIRINDGTQDERVVVEIADPGKGITPETLASLVDLSFKARSDRMRIGRGLPTAYNIIKQHEGEITAENDIGNETTVRIELPTRQKESK